MNPVRGNARSREAGKSNRFIAFLVLFLLLAATLLACPNAVLAQPFNWSQVSPDGFGDGNNDISSSMAVYNGLLYVGVENNATGTEVWEYDGANWLRVDPGAPGPGGFGNPQNVGSNSMAVYNGLLYVATTDAAAVPTGTEVWVYDGANWLRVDPGAPGPGNGGFGDPNNIGSYSMAVYNGLLYVGTMNGVSGTEIWAHDGTNWFRVDPGAPGPGGFGDGASNVCTDSMAVYAGLLHVGTWNGFTGTEVWDFDGANWNQVNADGFGDPLNNAITDTMAAYNGALYAGVFNNVSGAQVWCLSGANWNQVNVGGFGYPSNLACESMAVYNNRLFVGTLNPASGSEVWGYDGINWDRYDPGGPGSGGFLDPNNYSICGLASFDGSLVAGTLNGGPASTGTEVWATQRASGSTTWYLAEGSTGTNQQGTFETWVLVQNPTINPATVNLTYMTPSGAQPGPTLNLAPQSRHTVNVADDVPNEFSVSTTVTSDEPVIAERSMYWNAAGGPDRQAAHDSIGVTAPSYSWFLAEGSTGADQLGSFETWVLVQNPGVNPATVNLTYMTPVGPAPGPILNLAPGTRQSVNVADLVPSEWSVSTTVTSNEPVIAERSMYWSSAFTYRQAAHDSIGVTAPASEWFLAEGSTGGAAEGDFETWVLVQNPGVNPATVNLTYMTPTGARPGPTLNLAPGTRDTVDVAQEVPNEWSVSTTVTSSEPVIAERSMYWNYAGSEFLGYVYRQAAHDSIGVTTPAPEWYLAEGSTGWIGNEYNFETWVLVQNPGGNLANVNITYMTPSGAQPGPAFTLPPGTRHTVAVSDDVPNEWSVSTMVTSDEPVIAERSMYWNYWDPLLIFSTFRRAATDSIGYGI